jgi:arginase family enzyme
VRRIAVLDAPSNLGLRPPTATSVPGCAKAPGALRDQGLLAKLGARDAGCLTPPRYDPGDWRPGDGVAHAAEISAYSRALADRIGAIIDGGEFPVILGGDCSILIGAGVAMHRLGDAVGGRIGLVFVDGHSDFRHPGNASYVGAAAGEDLALVTGRGQADLAAIESRRPYFRDIDVVVLGIRAQDEYRLDLQAAGIVTRPVPALRAEGAARSAQWARDQLVDCAGYWVHVDVDVLDPAVMPAVDAPDPGGIAFPELEILLSGLVESPHCLGVEITVFDPDYDPDGRYAAEITSAVVSGLSPVRATSPRPDLIAARLDLSNTPDRVGPRTPRPTSRLGRAAAPSVPDPSAGSPAPDSSAGSSVSGSAVASSLLGPAAASPVSGPPVVSPVSGPPVVSPVSGSPVVSPVSGPPVVSPVSGSPVASPVSGPLSGPADGLPAADGAAAGAIADPVVASAFPGPVVDHPADDESPAGSSADGHGSDLSTEEPSADLDASSVAAPPASVSAVPGSAAPASLPSSSAESTSAPSADSAPASFASGSAAPASAASGSAVSVSASSVSALSASGLTTSVPFSAGVAKETDTVPEPEAALTESPAGDAEFVLAAALGPASVTGGTYPVGILADRDALADLDHPADLDASGDHDGPTTQDSDDDVQDSLADAVGPNGRSDPAGEADQDGPDDLVGDADEDEVVGGGEEPRRTGAFDWIGAQDSIDADGSADVVGDAADADPGNPDSSAEAGDEPADTWDAGDEDSDRETDAVAAADGTDEAVVTRVQEQNDTAIRLLSRPLGSAPLLDSEPLPATRPGMLRPRPPADPPSSGGLGSPVAGTGVIDGLPPGVA